jgi:hypothetical protein
LKRKLTTREWEQRQEQRRRRSEEISRSAHDLLGFWRICSERQCRRVQSCSGDLQPCFWRHWPLVPLPIKVNFRAMVKATAEGASPEEATRIGDEAMARELAKMDAAAEAQ